MELPPSLGHLKALRALELRNNARLQILGSGLPALTSLHTLYVENCDDLADAMTMLPNLTVYAWSLYSYESLISRA